MVGWQAGARYLHTLRARGKGGGGGKREGGGEEGGGREGGGEQGRERKIRVKRRESSNLWHTQAMFPQCRVYIKSFMHRDAS